MSKTDGTDGRDEELTSRSNTIAKNEKVTLVIELVFAMLALEREGIDEVLPVSGALVSDDEEPSRQFGDCRHAGSIRVRLRRRAP